MARFGESRCSDNLFQQFLLKSSQWKEALIKRSFLSVLWIPGVSASAWEHPGPPRAPFSPPHPSHSKAPRYLPDLVMIISVPSSWNLSQSSLVSRLQAILAISSLGMMGVVGISGSVHREEEDGLLLLPPPPNSPWASRLVSSPRGWAHDDFSTNCSAGKENGGWQLTLSSKDTGWGTTQLK